MRDNSLANKCKYPVQTSSASRTPVDLESIPQHSPVCDICIAFAQYLKNVEDVGPLLQMLYKCVLFAGSSPLAVLHDIIKKFI